MRVALIAQDKPGALQIRLDNRAAHLAHIEASGIVEMAGPLLTPEGTMSGSLVILSVEDMAQAQAWADADPYALAGLFQSVTLTEWKKVIG
ncbi:YciI family protein [Pseudorhodobacter sp. E13]|uniref:YciI family protein n=1 Tax=Pseudorhodobacter sp. E13 TaxID=2487931 RepID=UPI000F8D385E|nr:YciI family protein [Pseudorhodobacter sp. E13]RUS59550.1 YciI family protein [Pseudorhodobacter sp. E13]